jgi:hypothetical protein
MAFPPVRDLQQPPAMRTIGIGVLTFGVTTSLLVPAALHVLDAGPKQVAKLMAPDSQSLTIGDTKIDVLLDKSFAKRGDIVKLKLVSSGDKPVTVSVLELESEGSGGGRVVLPPSRVARENVTIPANGTRELTFHVRAKRASEMEGIDSFGRDMFVVMAPAAASRFDRLRGSAMSKNPLMGEAPDYEAFMNVWNRIGGDDADGDDSPPANAASSVARVDVLTRSESSTVSIKSPDTMALGKSFPVVVTVKNPTQHRLEGVEVRLQSHPDMIAGAYQGLADSMVTITGETKVDLAPHQSRTVEFQVTATAAGTLGLFATTRCEACGYTEDRMIDAVALDAVDITAETTTVVGTR